MRGREINDDVTQWGRGEAKSIISRLNNIRSSDARLMALWEERRPFNQLRVGRSRVISTCTMHIEYTGQPLVKELISCDILMFKCNKLLTRDGSMDFKFFLPRYCLLYSYHKLPI